MGQLEFVEAGAAVTVQDLGRIGHRATGVPVSGAADPVLMACAQALLAQDGRGLAALEVGLLGPSLRVVEGPVRLALAGDFAPVVRRGDGSVIAASPWTSMNLQTGEELVVGSCRSGIGYLALSGGALVPLVLGSRSTYARAGLGGMQGRAPQAGDRLPCGSEGGASTLLHAPQAWRHLSGPLRVVRGPQADSFDESAWQAFTGSGYTVTRQADRMGVRLQGTELRYSAGCSADIVSEAVMPGAVQVPGAGQPIVLGVDAQTIGGYAKIATVISADLPRLAHLRPGEVVHFALVTPQQALQARHELAAALQAWVAGLAPLRTAAAIDEVALYTTNLISGMIAADPPLPD